MTSPDLTGIRIIHRAMRGDLHRLVALTEHLAATTPTRARAIARFVGRITHTIHQHHTREDEIVWPLIERSAGAAADLSDLTEDHSLLDPLLNEADAAADAFAAGGDARPLHLALKRLSELLDEHIEEEERRIFPVVLQYVTEKDWAEAENRIRKGGDIRFDLCWVGQYATPEELRRIRRLAGPMITLMLALLRPGHRRRQRLIFG
ncbi:hemerythrin domain-containing protein [Herbidospora daliensis]|uniref:hemerythrin domain-containing protein n=1 Tax=Herbidospora daliensis TaxID=295585 RepID=UPI0007842738|nr:hemerythrin domain-containing protein [Herbidospora daliensis]